MILLIGLRQYNKLYLVMVASAAVQTYTDLKGHCTVKRYAHRRRRGLCVTCGYDLRASSDRCPECDRTIWPARLPPIEGVERSASRPHTFAMRFNFSPRREEE